MLKNATDMHSDRIEHWYRISLTCNVLVKANNQQEASGLADDCACFLGYELQEIISVSKVHEDEVRKERIED